MKITGLKINEENPRKINKAKLESLKENIKDFPKMMELRPIVYDPETMKILGGNMRLRALKLLGYKEIPEGWIKSANELTEEEKEKFIIEDNVQFGEWDFSMLYGWEQEKLEKWGLDTEEKTTAKPEEREIEPYIKTHILISFPPEKITLIQKELEKIKEIEGIEFIQSSN